MNNHLFASLVLPSILTILCVLIAIPSSYSDDGELYKACRGTNPCGQHISYIPYPFWGNDIHRPRYCGRKAFELKCQDNQRLTIQIEDQSFRIVDINNTHPQVTIARDDFIDDNICPGIFQKTVINHTLYKYSPNVGNLRLFHDCSGDLTLPGQNNFSCPSERGEVKTGFYTIDEYDGPGFDNRTSTCKSVIEVPILWSNPQNIEDLLTGKLIEALKRGFEVEYLSDNEFCGRCETSLGICGSKQPSDELACLCRDKFHTLSCPGKRRNLALKFFPALTAGIIGVTAACILICILRPKTFTSTISKACCRKISKSDQDLESFIRNYGPLAPTRYIYSNVKKMTNSFKDKLGQGGYGSVYKGMLPGGRIVAVKLLNKSKGNGQEFINEVASISRTSHVNVVQLLGFCFEGSKRALIYEFMPNGSLEKFIHNGDTSKPAQHLGWEKMYEIVTGIARGLEYLHRGCNTRILHFDIKPHNILLDEDFCPKISDFGMAKLCLNKESIVSMLEARGTIGYIAPEVFSRNFGVVSHKSDVYSYGMMIMELVGCKNNLDVEVDHSSEVYFPHWIYRYVEQGKEFKLPGAVTGEENEIVKKLIIVGLWCIQARPSDRPSMNKVIEMLQLSIEALQIPSMPFLSSPPRLPIDSSTISLS